MARELHPSGQIVNPGFSGAVGSLKEGQLDQLAAAGASACRTLREALRNIENPPAGTRKNTVCYQTLICQNKEGVLAILRKGISRTCDDRLEFEIEPDSTGRCRENPDWDAYVMTRMGWRYSTIHVCVPRFFNRDSSQYAGTIIHEITHTGRSEDPPEGGGAIEDWRNAHMLQLCLPDAATWR
jgi:hypothetical protein